MDVDKKNVMLKASVVQDSLSFHPCQYIFLAREEQLANIAGNRIRTSLVLALMMRRRLLGLLLLTVALTLQLDEAYGERESRSAGNKLSRNQRNYRPLRHQSASAAGRLAHWARLARQHCLSIVYPATPHIAASSQWLSYGERLIADDGQLA
jgi:hypothetical protein